MDVITKVRYFLMLHFQFSKFRQIKIFGKSPDQVQFSLKSSNHKLESSKNIVLPRTKSTDDFNKSFEYYVVELKIISETAKFREGTHYVF